MHLDDRQGAQHVRHGRKKTSAVEEQGEPSSGNTANKINWVHPVHPAFAQVGGVGDPTRFLPLSEAKTNKEVVGGLSGNAMPPIPKPDIKARSDAGTLMPDGITNWMGEQQRLDLLRYLFQLGLAS
jgi:hypothetical protein